MADGTPVIPDYIVVHLGDPNDRTARNIRVSFPEYIKNVASSEIYPTWPENAIRANIYAQISYALNRVYTEWYRSQGYDFDITNSTRYDQSFVEGREIFENISRIVDEMFDSYLTRPGSVEPLFAQYCNGTTVTCPGLSQWGTVPLAEQGMTPYEILTTFYGDDLNIVRNAPVRTPIASYPDRVLRRGEESNEVRDLQVRLNRISTNYPGIPKIYPVNGIFGESTERAVRAFQRQFNLVEDGLVGKATWYRIAYVYTSVKRLAELDSEGLSLAEVSQQYPNLLREGQSGLGVQILQYRLAVVSQFLPTIPAPPLNGIFDAATTASVRAFQEATGLTVDGIVGRATWNMLLRAYDGIRAAVPNAQTETGVPIFPGGVLSSGSTGSDVTWLQEAINYIAQTYPEVPTLPVTGYFGDQTAAAVMAIQELVGLPPTGTVGPLAWDAIANLYEDLRTGSEVQLGQYPGYQVGEEETS